MSTKEMIMWSAGAIAFVVIVAAMSCGCQRMPPQPALPGAFASITRSAYPPGKNCRWKAAQYARSLTAAGIPSWVICTAKNGALHAMVLTGTTLEDPTTGVVVGNGDDFGEIQWVIPASELTGENWQ